MGKTKKDIIFSKKWALEQKNTVTCKCGIRTYLIQADRTICRGCGHWVYRNKAIQLKYEMKSRGVLECV